MAIVDEVRNKISSNLEGTSEVLVQDNTPNGSCDGGAMLEVTVVSTSFEGLPLLKRHRLVNDILSDLMADIHALQMKTWTPAQYESKK